MLFIDIKSESIDTEIIKKFKDKLIKLGLETSIKTIIRNYINIPKIDYIIIDRDYLVSLSFDEKLNIVSLSLKHNVPIYIQSINEIDFEFMQMCEAANIKFYKIENDIDLEKKIDLSKLTDMEFGTIVELFENNFEKYNIEIVNHNTAINKINIIDNTIAVSNNILPLTYDNLFLAYCKLVNSERDCYFNADTSFLSQEVLFSLNLYDPIILLSNSLNKDTLCNDIIEYKFKVFNIIKNLKIEDYKTLDFRLCKLLNMNNFVSLDKIKEIFNCV